MLRKLFVLLAATLALTAHPALAQRDLGIFALDPVNDGNTLLAIEGNGAVTRQADVAVFTAGVTTTGETAQEALQANAKKMREVLAAARAMGVPAKDIQTRTTSVRPVMSDNRRQVAIYQSFAEGSAGAAAEAAEAVADAAEAALEGPPARTSRDQAPRIIGYTASNLVTVKQRDLTNFGKTIDTLVAAGANRVDGPDFRLEDSASSEQEARILAVADARRQAEEYAAAADLKVVRIVMIGEGRISGLRSRDRVAFMMAEAAAGDYYETPIASGELGITARIGMLFELAPK